MCKSGSMTICEPQDRPRHKQGQVSKKKKGPTKALKGSMGHCSFGPGISRNKSEWTKGPGNQEHQLPLRLIWYVIPTCKKEKTKTFPTFKLNAFYANGKFEIKVSRCGKTKSVTGFFFETGYLLRPFYGNSFFNLCT